MENRRNSLTPAMERQKTAELKKLNVDGQKRPDQVYAIYHYVDGKQKYFYVGVSVDPSARWAQHVREARSGKSSLPEYEQMRYVGVENCYMEVLDPEGACTEREWEEALKADGHVLLNTPGKTVDSKRKKRTTYEHRAALEGLMQVKWSEKSAAILEEHRQAAIASGSAWAAEFYK